MHGFISLQEIDVLNWLNEWEARGNRKLLVTRRARQVGKISKGNILKGSNRGVGEIKNNGNGAHCRYFCF